MNQEPRKLGKMRVNASCFMETRSLEPTKSNFATCFYVFSTAGTLDLLKKGGKFLALASIIALNFFELTIL